MIWNYFPYFAYTASFFWLIAIATAFIPKQTHKVYVLSIICTIFGLLIQTGFIVLLWQQLERPPMRTLGETRLWYAIFIPLCALGVELRYKFRWLKVYCLSLTLMFLVIELMNPQNIDKTLPPALQSPWFIPHVIVYMIGYAFLGSAALLGVHGIIQHLRKKNIDYSTDIAHQMTVIGFVFINLGLIFGAFWAKEAWGHYWTWDPKETWAFLTWLVYIVYLHIVNKKYVSKQTLCFILTIGFAVLMLCWFGINYFATAAQSAHSYR